jgi:hypothetical protein
LIHILFLFLVVNFNFSVAFFLVTTLRLGTYVNKLLFLRCTVIENNVV